MRSSKYLKVLWSVKSIFFSMFLGCWNVNSRCIKWSDFYLKFGPLVLEPIVATLNYILELLHQQKIWYPMFSMPQSNPLTILLPTFQHNQFPTLGKVKLFSHISISGRFDGSFFPIFHINKSNVFGFHYLLPNSI